MEVLPTISSIFAIFISIIILDYIWLGIIVKDFLISQFGSLIKVIDGSIQIKLGVGLLTWLIIAIGVFIFAVNPADSLSRAIILGAILGFITYAIYDLTNLTFIVNYPVRFVFVDIAWGTFLCAVISGIGFFVKSLF